MLRARHLSVGVAAALAVLQPDNLFECLAVTGIAAVGSAVGDIDADQSKVRREADLMFRHRGCRSGRCDDRADRVPRRPDQILKREPDPIE